MALYAQRYSRIENDIRDLKVTLNLEQIRAQSDAMVRKEILCGMVLQHGCSIEASGSQASQGGSQTHQLSTGA